MLFSFSREAQLCLSRKQNCASTRSKSAPHESKKKKCVCVPLTEASLCLHEKKSVPLAEAEKTWQKNIFFFFREAQLCLLRKKTFASTRSKIVPLVEDKKYM